METLHRRHPESDFTPEHAGGTVLTRRVANPPKRAHRCAHLSGGSTPGRRTAAGFTPAIR